MAQSKRRQWWVVVIAKHTMLVDAEDMEHARQYARTAVIDSTGETRATVLDIVTVNKGPADGHGRSIGVD